MAHVGYLREAYHGDPYATEYLVAEAFVDGSAAISGSLLEARLDAALELAEERERNIYDATDDEIEPVLQSYRDFVALGTYRYLDMHQAIGSALRAFENEVMPRFDRTNVHTDRAFVAGPKAGSVGTA